uniref:NR LBD domain-containing protein n=1 Tax=Globodera pallida TaxID=36090 RepID=A0A183CPM1_GLOPA
QQCNERLNNFLEQYSGGHPVTGADTAIPTAPLIRHNLASFTVYTDVELVKRVDFAYEEAYSAYVSHNLPIDNDRYVTMGVDPPQHFEGVNAICMRYKQAYLAYARARSSANQSCGTMVVDPQQLDRLMNMNRADGWLKFANVLTNVTKCSIMFAKTLKEFGEVEKHHRILTLKKAAFELALIVMAQHYHQPSQTLRVHNIVLPVDKFRCTDKEDEEFGKELISVLQLLSSFQLNGTESALLCAFVLMEQTPGMNAFVGQLKKWLAAKLHQRMSSNAGDKALRELFECLAVSR